VIAARILVFTEYSTLAGCHFVLLIDALVYRREANKEKLPVGRED